MGNKLKTWKDIQITNGIVSINYNDELRQEAIKWIKKLDDCIIYPYGKDIPIVDGSNKLSKLLSSDKFIKMFFNITENDLK